MLTDEMIQFLLDVGGGMLCTRDADNRPAIVECFFVEVSEDRLVGLVAPHLLTDDLVGNVADNSQFALTTSRVPGSHRSIQLKGRVAEILPDVLRPDDFTMAMSNPTELYPGIPRDFDTSRFQVLADRPIHRLVFEVEEVYDQTPGPNAGSPVRATA